MRALLLCLALTACDAGRTADDGNSNGSTTGGTTGGGTTGNGGNADGGNDLSATSSDGGGSDGSVSAPDLARNCLYPDLKAFNLDVKVVTISGKITVNHAAVVLGTNDIAGVYLKNDRYDQIQLSDLKSGSYSQQVVPDTYDVYYQELGHGFGGNLPTNYGVKIAGPVTISAAMTLDIDIPATTVSGSIKFNHAAPPTSGSDGHLELRPAGTNSVGAPLGGTLSGSYSALIAPGSYDLYYGHDDGKLAPANYQSLLQAGVVVGNNPVTINVDIPSVTVSGKITINGVAPPTATSGSIYFADSTKNDELVAAETSDQTYSVQVVPSTYDIYYQSSSFSTNTVGVPDNFRIYLKKGVNLSSTTSLDLDVPAATVSGTLKLNGAAPGAMSGSVLLSGVAPDGAYLGKLSAGSYSQLVAPGTYDVYFLGDSGGSPASSYARLLKGVVVHSGANTLDLNVVTYLLSGNFTLNGAAPPASASAMITLRDATMGGQIALGDLAGGHYAVQVIGGGTFDAYYDWKSGSGIPVNTGALIPLGKSIQSATTLNIDIPAVAVSGMMTFNGVPVSTGGEAGTFGLSTPGSAVLGDSSAVSYSVMVLPGIYDVSYQYKSGTSVVPHDIYRQLFCAHVGN